MSDTAEEEVYSTIFNALRHGVRRRILRMLSERQMTFTAINENLSISSSHLTYHLDSLEELVSKNDSYYRLSVFGRAAVNMMNGIEEPPNLEGKLLNQRTFVGIIAILLLGFIVMSGFYINLHNDYRDVSHEYELMSSELETITSEYGPLKELKYLLTQHPNAFLVSGYSLEYEETWGANFTHTFSTEGFYAVFYVPLDNLTLRMHNFIYFPMDDFAIPLTLQRGNAFLNESGVLVSRSPVETTWQSPVVWSVNATGRGVCEARLPSRGWYTLSMVGPIRTGNGGGVKLRFIGARWVNGTLVKEDRVQAWVNIQVMRGEEPILFAVSRLM